MFFSDPCISKLESKSEILIDYQIAYFTGMMERQDPDKELLEMKLRVMKAAETKLGGLNAEGMLNMLSEQLYLHCVL